MTFLHIPLDQEKNFVSFSINKSAPKVIDTLTFNTELNDSYEDGGIMPNNIYIIDYNEKRGSIPHGVYNSIHDVVRAVNDLPFMKSHMKLKINCGGYTTIDRVCDSPVCDELDHTLVLSPVIEKILGIRSTANYEITLSKNSNYTGSRPASLSGGIPTSMFIYTDICESYITGDIQTPLLRVVPLEVDKYSYGDVKIKSFSSPRYIPLMRRGFQTIEIDIRDEYGEPIPFEHGTLTVTLQFKRLG